MTNKRTQLQELYKTLSARKRPEDVAQMVLEVLDTDLKKRERTVLGRAARGSLKNKLVGVTSMLEDFAQPDGLERQVRVAEQLFQTPRTLTAYECTQPDIVEPYVADLCREIGKGFGKSEFLYHRLNRQTRKALDLDISKRRYNKMFRLLGRMERKLKKLVRELKKLEFQKIGKSSLASKLSWEEFARDRNTACFIAYYTARCNLRSQFTISGQTKPYDNIADMLFVRAVRQSPNWWSMAHVYPVERVLRELSDEQKGQLCGTWFTTLTEVAELLREVWNASNINRETMIVRRGNDSSTWNNTANAWNKARAGWIGLLYAMGLDHILDTVCPGKVLRLMAADVAAWHRVSGGGLDPQTDVWNDLPLPWEVLGGETRCSRAVVKRVCQRHGVDAHRSGWITPPPAQRPVRFAATPELVHGVTVSSPVLAKTLRKAGWFSGQVAGAAPLPAKVRRDEHGFATGVEEGSAWSRFLAGFKN